MQNLRLEAVIAVPVRHLPAESPAPEDRVLAELVKDGCRQQIMGWASDLPGTLAWLEEQGTRT